VTIRFNDKIVILAIKSATYAKSKLSLTARDYFMPLKKGVVLPLAIVKGVELPLEHIKRGSYSQSLIYD